MIKIYKANFLVVLIIIFTFFFCSFNKSCASIETLNSFENVVISSEKYNSETLVIFDVDDVILIQEDKILQGNAESKKYLKEMFKQADKLFGPLESSQWDLIKSEILLSSKRQILEQKIVSVIQKIQQMGSKVIVLTACQTGSCGLIKSLPHWRVKELESYGISFKQSFPKLNNTFFNTKDFINERKPYYLKGCIFSTGYDKGTVLKEFLNSIKILYENWQPQRIIFFDNEKINLEDVQKTANSLNIPYNGFLYTFTPPAVSIDLELAKFQIHTLFKKYVWLNDHKAKIEREKDCYLKEITQ